MGEEPEKGRRWTTPDTAMALALVTAFAIRFLVLREGGAPPSVDGGYWLAQGKTIFGSTIPSSEIVYPPLVPLLTLLSVNWLGLTAGVSAVGAAASVAPGFGLYVALRMLGHRWIAIASALLVLGASSVGEATAWGGYPQLIGFGIAPVGLVLFERTTRTLSRRTALATGLVTAALLGTSHFVAAPFALGFAFLLVIGNLRTVTWRGRLPDVLRCGFLVIAPSVVLIPLYLSLFQAFVGVSREFAFFTPLSWRSLWDSIEFLYRDFAWVWRVVLGLAIAGPFVLRRYSFDPLWKVATAQLLAIMVMLAATREARFVYMLTPYGGIGLALWLRHATAFPATPRVASGATTRHRYLGPVAIATTVVIGLAQISTGVGFFREQRGYYGILTPELVSGIEEVRRTTDSDAVLVVTSLNDAPLGRWVEAIAERETYFGSPLRWLLLEEDIARTSFANELFIPPFPNVQRIREAAKAGIDLMLIPTRWVFFDEKAIAQFAALYPGAITYMTDELVVIDPSLVP